MYGLGNDAVSGTPIRMLQTDGLSLSVCEYVNLGVGLLDSSLALALAVFLSDMPAPPATTTPSRCPPTPTIYTS